MGIKSILAEWQNLPGGKVARLVEEATGQLNLYLNSSDTSTTELGAVATYATDNTQGQTLSGTAFANGLWYVSTSNDGHPNPRGLEMAEIWLAEKIISIVNSIF